MFSWLILVISISFASEDSGFFSDTIENIKNYFNPPICKPEQISNHVFSIKDPSQARNYVHCVLPPQNQITYDKIRPHIENSANHFGLNSTLLNCLFLQESKYDLNAVSNQNAKGIAQFVDVTSKFVDTIISKGSLSPSQSNKIQEALKSNDSSEKKWAQSRWTTYKMQQLWQSYFVDQNKKAPTQFTSNMAFKPEYAVPAAALYLHYTFDLLFKALVNLNKDPMNLNEQEWLDLYLIAAGSYNAGHGLAVSKLNQKIKSENLISQWKSKLIAANPETSAHIQEISKCMQMDIHPGVCK